MVLLPIYISDDDADSEDGGADSEEDPDNKNYDYYPSEPSSLSDKVLPPVDDFDLEINSNFMGGEKVDPYRSIAEADPGEQEGHEADEEDEQEEEEEEEENPKEEEEEEEEEE